MSLNVTLPPSLPNALQPQTEAARTDNRRAELIPQPPQGAAASGSQKSASQQDQERQTLRQGLLRDGAMREGAGTLSSAPHSLPQRVDERGHQDGQGSQQGTHRESHQDAERAGDQRGSHGVASALVFGGGLSTRVGQYAHPGMQGGVLNAYMEIRSQAIAQRYRTASRPATPQQFDLKI
ncbi:hypothetical protein [Aeromonas rivuli]|uniref:hypothetical protein n=1 Tax=Aeromonas rivuli TaxID=648794 RepID=UPI001CCB47A4|nr:hypothetical protein [Aeromonas rivuli]UBO76126.1 hypothetical protein KYK33_18625 [Aeromonas rivuli]